MIEDLANMAPVEIEMGVAEVNEGDTSDKEQHPGVVSLARRLKRIVTKLVTVWQVVNVMFFFPSVPACVAREIVIVARKQNQTRLQVINTTVLNLTYLINGRSL